MTAIVIRQAGPYTVTSHENLILVDGETCAIVGLLRSRVIGDRTVTHMLETEIKSADGRRVVISLTATEYAIHQDAARAWEMSRPRSLEEQRKALFVAVRALQDADYEDRRNGVETTIRTGRAPALKDRTTDIAAARAALDVFDTDHPEVLAAIQAANASRVAENVRAALNA